MLFLKFINEIWIFIASGNEFDKDMNRVNEQWNGFRWAFGGNWSIDFILSYALNKVPKDFILSSNVYHILSSMVELVSQVT